MESEHNQVEVTYKFRLPDNQDELSIFHKANEYSSTLYSIYNICRDVWKYEEEPNKDKLELAESIGNTISETGVLDD